MYIIEFSFWEPVFFHLIFFTYFISSLLVHRSTFVCFVLTTDWKYQNILPVTASMISYLVLSLILPTYYMTTNLGNSSLYSIVQYPLEVCLEFTSWLNYYSSLYFLSILRLLVTTPCLLSALYPCLCPFVFNFYKIIYYLFLSHIIPPVILLLCRIEIALQ